MHCQNNQKLEDNFGGGGGRQLQINILTRPTFLMEISQASYRSTSMAYVVSRIEEMGPGQLACLVRSTLDGGDVMRRSYGVKPSCLRVASYLPAGIQ